MQTAKKKDHGAAVLQDVQTLLDTDSKTLKVYHVKKASSIHA
jgi:hypothetical protein